MCGLNGKLIGLHIRYTTSLMHEGSNLAAINTPRRCGKLTEKRRKYLLFIHFLFTFGHSHFRFFLNELCQLEGILFGVC